MLRTAALTRGLVYDRAIAGVALRPCRRTIAALRELSVFADVLAFFEDVVGKRAVSSGGARWHLRFHGGNHCNCWFGTGDRMLRRFLR